jgi:protein Tex
VPGLGRRRSSRRPASCASAAGEHPLDATACTPSATRWWSGSRRTSASRCGRWSANEAAVRASSRALRRATASGLPTLEDIVAELRKPGRDPREAFEAPAFRDDVQTLDDLREGMVLQGTSPTWSPSARSWTSACTRTGWCTSRSSPTASCKDPNDVVRSATG